MSEQTSAAVAAIAARGITHPESLTPAEVKRVCASALTQREAMQHFVNRVDKGEVRSKRTYEQFKGILAGELVDPTYPGPDDQHPPEGG